MRFSSLGLAGLGLLGSTAYAQGGSYTDSKTGIKFYEVDVSGETSGVMRFGLALPATTQTSYADEYIGHMVFSLTSNGGWGGLAHGGGMTTGLLLAVWPSAGKVVSSFRVASGYVAPDIYNGNATFTTISSTVNSTHLDVVYRCQHCWVWSQAGYASGSQIPPTAAGGNQVLGWAQHTATPVNPSDPDASLAQHAYYDIAVLPAASARNSAYTSWASLGSGSNSAPTSTAKPTSSTAAPSATKCASNQAAPTVAYDYIIAGAGAGGIPIAAKLSEDGGKKVLLIEKGPPSTGRWGGKMAPDWLAGSGLTRFDVPGLCNEIWVDSAGIACKDASSMAGCVLGGGTAVNAGLWWKPNPADFDVNFPVGWRSYEMAAAISRVFQKIPGTYIPSMDGKTYLRQGFNSIVTALSGAGWSGVDANAAPGSKNRTYTQTPYMFSNGERGGPLATYLVEASKRSNFKMITDTGVKRIIRTNGHATGVELEPQNGNGICGNITLSAKGRVIVSAGVFGTSKILMRSGIGPSDQLAIVKSSADGPTMIPQSQWINLPVGMNLDDHTNTDTVIQDQDSVFYDFYAAFDSPIPADASAYLNKRSGILAQSAPNIGPVFFDVIPGSVAGDGKDRQLQWTARVEGSAGFPNNNSMTISQYLGRGKTSKGRMTITSALNMVISDPPYQKTAGDIAAVVQGIKNLQAAIAKNPRLTMVYPAPGQKVEDFVSSYPNTVGARTANHWIGTAKMGTDSGLNGGTSVVDTNTKVYGTDNIFVVDASVFPGMMSNNPSALIVSVAERAWEFISGLN